ncbi:kinase [Candidatus Woesearchaeota archaeon]|nr:AAA family ATPase [Candidatus Woesearchaeota archaeon]RLE42847.1 MAG: kinase [Candidatus Woesearchaeota archaeon]
MLVIAVTGTPGTGKTTIAKLLAKQLGFEYISLNEFAKQHGLFEGYDKKKKCHLVDTKKLARAFSQYIKNVTKKGVVADSHLAHYLPRAIVGLCVVTTCSKLKELEKRLKERGYSKAKVRENLDAEIFRVCLIDAIELGHNVVELDTSKLSPEACVKMVKSRLALGNQA